MHFCSENYLAGSILLDATVIDLARAIAQPDDFESEPCRAVYQAALKLSDAGEKIDPVTLQNKAAEMGYPLSNDYLAQLMEMMPTAANAGLYATRVHSDAQRRLLQRAALAVVEDSTTPLAELAAQMRSAVEALDSTNAKPFTSAQQCSAFLEAISGNNPLISTGYPGLDRILGGGMMPGGLYIVGGRPGTGKTALAVNMLDRISGPVLFASLEMPLVQIVARRVAIHCGVSAIKMLQGSYTEAENFKIVEAVSLLSQSPAQVTDKAMTLARIEECARAVPGLKCLIIDYLHLIQSDDGSGGNAAIAPYMKITAISAGLKRMAKRLNVPVVCLAQLNRDCEKENREPKKSDLRDSGYVEQDADGIFLLHTVEENQDADRRTVTLNLDKNRHGATGTLCMAFHPASGVFEE